MSHGYTLETNDRQRATFNSVKETPRIPELDLPQQIPKYQEAPMEEVLYPIVEQHQVLIVAGAFFGDEGKGKTVDALAKHPKCGIVARTNSGENAGHTVLDPQGRKYIFHLAPSGLLIEGKRNMVGPECVMDPVSFMEKEVSQLIKNGVEYKTRLFIGNVHIVTPYHKLLDLLLSAPNSSTLKGMSPIHASKVTKKGIRMNHLFNDEETLRRRIKADMDTFMAVLALKKLTMADVLKRCEDECADGVPRIPPHVFDFVRAEDKMQYLIDLYNEKVVRNPQFPQRCDVCHEIRSELARGGKVLLEGPQSYWLSNARDKFWESSTSADTSAGGLVATAQYNFQKYKSVVFNVHKYPGASRVGIGANPAAFVPQDYFSAQNIRTLRDLPEGACTDFAAIQKAWMSAVRPNGIVEPLEYKDKTGTYNVGVAMSIASALHHGEAGATTLKPRITGLFDCVAHFEVNAAQGPYLSISAVDRGDDYDELGVTVAYVYHHPEGKTFSSNGVEFSNGKVIKPGDPYPSEAALHHCYPIVKKTSGWKTTPVAYGRREVGAPLPPGVCELIATIEHFTKAQVLSIGNGPEGKNIIYLKQ